MSGKFSSLSQANRWALLVTAGKRGAQEQGFSLTREPGRGLSNMWKLQKGGKTQLAAIRTSQDRWFAFPPLDGGTKWKTLDDVDLVVLAVVDSPEDPQKIEVYVFPQQEVRQRFVAAYKARIKAGHVQKEDFGMWVALDDDKRGSATSVGSGIAGKYKPVAVYSIDELLAADAEQTSGDTAAAGDDGAREEVGPTTIAGVMQWARTRVAEIAGVSVDAVRLELKLES